MFLKFLSIAFFILLCSCSSTKTPLQLFNGHDLNGWKMVGDGKFVVENNLLKSEGGMGLLYYAKQTFGNVKINVVYKVPYSDTNSGIFVRIAHPPKDAWDAVHHGYEIQICDTGKDAFDAYHTTGAVYTFSKALKVTTNKPGEWNHLQILLRDKTITVIMNGSKVSEYTLNDSIPARARYSDPQRGERPVYGYIGLQNHDHDAAHANSHIYFKEISITSL